MSYSINQSSLPSSRTGAARPAPCTGPCGCVRVGSRRAWRWLATGLACLPLGLQAQAPFELSDSGPGTVEFRERFLANYGVNSAIEPSISQEDRPLYERVAPMLRDNPQGAIRELEAALQGETNAAFNVLLGSLYYQAERYTDAEAQLREAVRKFPDFRRAYRTLGLIYVQDGRYPEAITAWLRVIALGGGDAQSYGLLAYAYLSEQKYASALSAYEMARMFKPDSEDFRRGAARCLLETDQPERAVALFEELIAEDPESADYWLLQANALVALERYDAAIANLEVVHALDKGTQDSRILLGNLYLRGDNFALALEHYTAALEEPGGGELGRLLRPLQYLIGRGLLSEAERYLAALKEYVPDTLEPAQAEAMAVAEARIATERGQRERALNLLRPIVERNPLNGEALLLAADLAVEESDFEAARLYLQRARSVPEREVDALIAMGRLEVAQENYDAALTHLREAQQMEPRPGVARFIEAIEALKR